MALESLEHLIRSKLAPEYGADKDLSTLMAEHWDQMGFTDNDRRRFGDRAYWDALTFGGGVAPANSILSPTGGHNLLSPTGGHYLVWS